MAKFYNDAKIKSIGVEVFDKASGNTTKAFLELDLKSAEALAIGSKFGSFKITEMKTEEISAGVNKITDFKIATKETMGDANLTVSIKNLNCEFKSMAGKDYTIKDKIFIDSKKESNPDSKLLSDVAAVAKAGFLGNKGIKHDAPEFYNGTIPLSQTQVTKDEAGNKVPKGTEGSTTVTYIGEVNPEAVTKALEFLKDRSEGIKAAKAEAAPKVEEVDEIAGR